MSAAVQDRLAELHTRAGASDQDRTQWLLARAQGVTATEVRDLWLRRRGVASLIAEKLTFLNAKTPEELEAAAQATFIDSKYTAWGRTREPVIAEVVQSVYPYLAPESRVFRSIENERWLGSPDGVGIDGHDQLVVSEIKTSKHDVRVGTQSFDRAGYVAQMTWIMRVTGARRCLYVTEQHDSDWQDRGGEHQEPTPLGLVPVMEWVEYDEALASQLELVATSFLVALDAARAGDAPEVVIDEELDTLALNYLRGLEAEKEGKALKESSYKAIVAMVDAGEPVVQESSLARVSWSPEVVEEKPVMELDQVRAKAAAPAGLYERFEQAQHDVEQAQAALGREQDLVTAHEASFWVEARKERVVVKKSALRVTAAKGTKEMKA